MRPGRAATLVAVCETSSRLRANQVYVLQGGVALTGWFVAARHNSVVLLLILKQS